MATINQKILDVGGGQIRGRLNPATTRQYDTLLIVARGQMIGVSPTIREIAMTLGINSTNGAMDHIKGLIRKGLLTQVEGRARSFKVTIDDLPDHPLSDVVYWIRLKRLAGCTLEEMTALEEAEKKLVGI